MSRGLSIHNNQPKWKNLPPRHLQRSCEDTRKWIYRTYIYYINVGTLERQGRKVLKERGRQHQVFVLVWMRTHHLDHSRELICAPEMSLRSKAMRQVLLYPVEGGPISSLVRDGTLIHMHGCNSGQTSQGTTNTNTNPKCKFQCIIPWEGAHQGQPRAQSSKRERETTPSICVGVNEGCLWTRNGFTEQGYGTSVVVSCWRWSHFRSSPGWDIHSYAWVQRWHMPKLVKIQQIQIRIQSASFKV